MRHILALTAIAVLAALTTAAGGAGAGGAEGQTFTDPAGPEATEEMLRFFASHPRRN